jgi:hypothetical protein
VNNYFNTKTGLTMWIKCTTLPTLYPHKFWPETFLAPIRKGFLHKSTATTTKTTKNSLYNTL